LSDTLSSFNNFCLKYVDASFYQVARGLVLPFTVITSLLFLRAAPPSYRIFIACAIVTGGFFTGVFLDHVTASGLAKAAADAKAGSGPSAVGIFFGILSSMTTALHAVVIKRALDVVDGSAIDLAWYTNLLSAVAILPIIVLAGEIPGITKLLFGADGALVGENSALGTFLWGTAVTVRSFCIGPSSQTDFSCVTGAVWISYLRGHIVQHQGHVSHYAYGVVGRARCDPDVFQRVDLRGYHFAVRLFMSSGRDDGSPFVWG
jgi:hypothetical protein